MITQGQIKVVLMRAGLTPTRIEFVPGQPWTGHYDLLPPEWLVTEPRRQTVALLDMLKPSPPRGVAEVARMRAQLMHSFAKLLWTRAQDLSDLNPGRWPALACVSLMPEHGTGAKHWLLLGIVDDQGTPKAVWFEPHTQDYVQPSVQDRGTVEEVIF